MKLIISILFILNMHPIHITITNIEYNEKDNNYDLVFKVFSDDFETIINKNYNAELNIFSNESINKNKKIISRYFRNNFNISINEKSLIGSNFIFYKHKSNHEATWFYFKLDAPDNKINNITIINKLMNELFQDQKNLTFFKNKTNEEAVSFNNNNIIKRFEIE